MSPSHAASWASSSARVTRWASMPSARAASSSAERTFSRSARSPLLGVRPAASAACRAGSDDSAAENARNASASPPLASARLPWPTLPGGALDCLEASAARWLPELPSRSSSPSGSGFMVGSVLFGMQRARRFAITVAGSKMQLLSIEIAHLPRPGAPDAQPPRPIGRGGRGRPGQAGTSFAGASFGGGAWRATAGVPGLSRPHSRSHPKHCPRRCGRNVTTIWADPQSGHRGIGCLLLGWELQDKRLRFLRHFAAVTPWQNVRLAPAQLRL